jgi:hypothetical protein
MAKGPPGFRGTDPGHGGSAAAGDDMRLLFRLIGTWLLGIALILLIMDGTRSLAADEIIMTSLADTWTYVHAQSLEEVRVFLATRFFGPVIEPTVSTILTLPGWLVLAVPGALLALLGRTRRARVFVRQDQF